MTKNDEKAGKGREQGAESNGKGDGKKVRRRGKGRGFTRRKMEGLRAWIESGSLTEAAKVAKIDRRNASRYFQTQEIYRMMQEELLKEGVGPASVAKVMADLMKATKFLNDQAADIALRYAKDSRKGQLYFFDPVTNQPRQGSFGVVADLRSRKEGAELYGKFMRLFDGDPEALKKMYEAGREAMLQTVLPLIEKLRPHLNEAGAAALEEGVRAMAGDGAAAGIEQGAQPNFQSAS